MRRGNQRGVLYGQRTLGTGAAAKQPTPARGGEGAAQTAARNLGGKSGWSGERRQNGGPGRQVCWPGSPGAEADRSIAPPAPSRRPQPRRAARTAGLVVWLEFCPLALPLALIHVSAAWGAQHARVGAPSALNPWAPPFCPRGLPSGSRVSVGKGLQGAPFPPVNWHRGRQ